MKKIRIKEFKNWLQNASFDMYLYILHNRCSAHSGLLKKTIHTQTTSYISYYRSIPVSLIWCFFRSPNLPSAPSPSATSCSSAPSSPSSHSSSRSSSSSTSSEYTSFYLTFRGGNFNLSETKYLFFVLF